jgi:hypothetical protein
MGAIVITKVMGVLINKHDKSVTILTDYVRHYAQIG